MSTLEGETMHLREEQDKHRHTFEVILQQLSNLAASYDHLASNHNSRDRSASKHISNNPLSEGG